MLITHFRRLSSLWLGAFIAGLSCAPISLALAEDAVHPIKLLIFPFELDDFSAGAQYVGESPEDAAQLSNATEAARKLIANSGRYGLAGTAAADAAPGKQRSLLNCDGCDAGVALRLGAEQSLVGVVHRISRTEYTIGFTIRDARTGHVIAARQTGLRMGANYSWDRGAASLIKQWLAESQGNR